LHEQKCKQIHSDSNISIEPQNKGRYLVGQIQNDGRLAAPEGMSNNGVKAIEQSIMVHVGEHLTSDIFNFGEPQVTRMKGLPSCLQEMLKATLRTS
jgi:hypothetical protein